ncbi:MULTISPECIES: hypothetical protein [unclassified Paenibacillus]|uniref:hypothetical protein n=1 Tax=unclassified Paenibacillus TaxID=185978 RepID=UPI001C120EE5|nr:MULTISPECIES: hypothetical protein [unclassified Paenibacillus]MBU5443960.1 hypothetical protein [Paenibacillus sp. MSJ-34]CAH0118741.1 hypothetical protein PAE9249_01235 [Paenibacillus sp. CECT 9249]
MRPAQLEDNQITRLKQWEEELRQSSGEHIVLIAYTDIGAPEPEQRRRSER